MSPAEQSEKRRVSVGRAFLYWVLVIDGILIAEGLGVIKWLVPWTCTEQLTNTGAAGSAGCATGSRVFGSGDRLERRDRVRRHVRDARLVRV